MMSSFRLIDLPEPKVVLGFSLWSMETLCLVKERPLLANLTLMLDLTRGARPSGRTTSWPSSKSSLEKLGGSGFARSAGSSGSAAAAVVVVVEI